MVQFKSDEINKDMIFLKTFFFKATYYCQLTMELQNLENKEPYTYRKCFQRLDVNNVSFQTALHDFIQDNKN